MLPVPVTQHGGKALSKMSLMEKIKLSWKGEEISPTVTRMSDMMASFSFLFVAITELYVILGYCIPYGYREWTHMSRYYLKVFACYVFVQSLANWLCVRCYQSKFKVTDDRPDLTKQLWDDHPQDIVQNGKMSPRADPQKTGQGERDYFASSSANLSLHWHYCYSCHMKVPPRAHHCKICKVCILRRDHHCYMTGVCIGHYNQRYFVVMNFYIIIASCYGLYEIVKYLGDNFYPNSVASDYFLPKTIYVWFMYDDEIPTEIMLMIVHCYFLWWTGFAAIGFFIMQNVAIFLGLTTHESQHQVPVRSTGSIAENFREVFGALWGFNYLWPAQIVFRQPGDGTSWPKLKPDRAKLIRNLREKMKSGKLHERHGRTDS